MNEDSIDEEVLAAIVARAENKVRERGEKIRRGDIRSITRDGSRIRARVSGSDVVPYRIDINARDGEVSCTCPYDWGEVCKHAVAVALLALSDGEAIERSSLRRTQTSLSIADLSEDDAIAILEELRQKFPRVVREFVAEQMHEMEYGDPDEEDLW